MPETAAADLAALRALVERIKEEEGARVLALSSWRRSMRVDVDSPFQRGLRRWEEYEKKIAQLQKNYMELSKLQAAIARDFARAALETIVGPRNFVSNPGVFMKRSGKTDTRGMMVVIMPRRFGKTTITSIFAAACALSVPNIKIGIFSPALRQSSALSKMIKEALDAMGVRKDRRYITENQETIEIRGDSAGDTREIKSYPGSVASLKGVTADLVIMEEMTQLPPETYHKVILPLYSVEGTTFLAISTPLGQDNFYTDALQQLDPVTKKPYWFMVQHTLVCDQCRENKTAASCRHNETLKPNWKRGPRQRIIKDILGGDLDYLTEMMGEFAGAKHPCLDPRIVNDVFSDLCSEPPSASIPIHLYLAIDPTVYARQTYCAFCLFIFILIKLRRRLTRGGRAAQGRALRVWNNHHVPHRRTRGKVRGKSV